MGIGDTLHIKLTDPDPSSDGHYKDSIYVLPLQKIRDADKNSAWSQGTYDTETTIKAESVNE